MGRRLARRAWRGAIETTWLSTGLGSLSSWVSLWIEASRLFKLVPINLRLLAVSIKALVPGDVAERAWTKVIVDLVRERRRLQRVRISLLERVLRSLAMNLPADPAVQREARLAVAERTDLASGAAAAEAQALATF